MESCPEFVTNADTGDHRVEPGRRELQLGRVVGYSWTLVTISKPGVADSRQEENFEMSEQELIFNVKELHIISLACGDCGHGTIFDFETADYKEKLISPKCAVCNTELEVDLKEQLNAYRCFYESMSRCERIEFRVRLNKPEAAGSASDVREAVSAAVTEVQEAVTTAFAKELAASGE